MSNWSMSGSGKRQRAMILTVLLGLPLVALVISPATSKAWGNADDEKILKVSRTVMDARVDRRVIPTYPIFARKARVEGSVILEFLVNEKGNVRDVSVISGPALLRRAAKAAIEKWHYDPIVADCLAIKVKTLAIITFRLH